MYDNLRVMEYMEFYGSMYGMRRSDIQAATERLLELVNLQDNTGDGFVLAFHQIGIVLLIGAYDEVFDGHADHVRSSQLGVCRETVEPEEFVV